MEQSNEELRLKSYMKQVRDKHKIIFIENKCIGCGLCVENCMVDLLYVDKNTNKVSLNNGYLCIGCYACVSNCPTGAVCLDDMCDLNMM